MRIVLGFLFFGYSSLILAQDIQQIGFVENCDPNLRVWVHCYYGSSLPPFPIDLISKKDSLRNDTLFFDFLTDHTIVAASPSERLDTISINCQKYSGNIINYLCVRQQGVAYDWGLNDYIILPGLFDIECVSNSFELSSRPDKVCEEHYSLTQTKTGYLLVPHQELTLEIYDLTGKIYFKDTLRKNQQFRISKSWMSIQLGVAIIRTANGFVTREFLRLL